MIADAAAASEWQRLASVIVEVYRLVTPNGETEAASILEGAELLPSSVRQIVGEINDLEDENARLRADARQHALRYLSEQGEWIESYDEHRRVKAERDRLKAAVDGLLAEVFPEDKDRQVLHGHVRVPIRALAQLKVASSGADP